MILDHVPTHSLIPSPLQYRTTMSEAGLAEMVESVKAIGIQQPIKVRPLNDVQVDAVARYEIIFGHRRHTAALRAGLEFVPILLEEMDDEAVRVAQLAENMQREDTSVLDEARAIAALRDECRLPMAEIVRMSGKSRSHVYNTLRLLNLRDDVAEFVTSGAIDREVAVLLASVPQSLQATAAARVLVKDSAGVRKSISFRAAKELLSKDLFIPLAKAPFEISSTELHDLRGSCTSCHIMSDNDPGLLADLGPGVCTDTGCFTKKRDAHNAAQLATHRAAGGQVLSEEEAKKAVPYAGANSLRDLCPPEAICEHDAQSFGQWAEHMRAAGEEPPMPVMFVHPYTHTVVTAYTEEAADLIDAYAERTLTAAGGDEEPDAQPQHAADTVDHDGSGDNPAPLRTTAQTSFGGGLYAKPPRVFPSPRHEQAFRLHSRIREAARAALLTTERNGDEVRICVGAMLEAFENEMPDLLRAFGWLDEFEAADISGFETGEWIVEHKLAGMTEYQLGTTLIYLGMEYAPHGQLSDDGYLDRVLQLADMYGIDIDEMDPMSERYRPIEPGPADEAAAAA